MWVAVPVRLGSVAPAVCRAVQVQAPGGGRGGGVTLELCAVAASPL